MTWAAWITALAALVTAITNGIAWIRHGREDDRRFTEHGKAIGELRNGRDYRPGEGAS